jgi:hypothetical protein
MDLSALRQKIVSREGVAGKAAADPRLLTAEQRQKRTKPLTIVRKGKVA